MGWIKKGKLVIPDGDSNPGTAEVEGEQITPSGIIVREEEKPPIKPPPARVLRRFAMKMQKKARKEAAKKEYNDRFGYLRPQPKPKKKHASADLKETN